MAVGAVCQYPISGKREDGTLKLCREPGTHYFDFSSGYQTSHRVVCAGHAKDPKGLYEGKTAIRIGVSHHGRG
jgi:hypothetical protein